MSEIKLTKRFPESRPEDITEAYMRGYEDGRKVSETCEVVRCRDCKHYHSGINGCDEFGDVWHDEYANVEPDGFCAWGERKNNG